MSVCPMYELILLYHYYYDVKVKALLTPPALAHIKTHAVKRACRFIPSQL